MKRFVVLLSMISSESASLSASVPSVAAIHLQLRESGLPAFKLSQDAIRRFRKVASSLERDKKIFLVEAVKKMLVEETADPAIVNLILVRWELMAALNHPDINPTLDPVRKEMRFEPSDSPEGTAANVLASHLRSLESLISVMEARRQVGIRESELAFISDKAETLASAYPGHPSLADLLCRLAELLPGDGRRERVEEIISASFGNTVAARRFFAEKGIGKTLALEFVDGVTGKSVDTRDLLGVPVVLYFWSPEGGQGKEGLLEMKALAERAGNEARFVGVAVGADRERVAAACREMGVGFPQYVEDVKPGEEGFAWSRGIGVEECPVTWILDREGKLKYVKAEGRVEKQLRRMGVEVREGK